MTTFNDPKNHSFVFAQATVLDGRPPDAPDIEITGTAFCAWRWNTVRVGPPTPPVYENQQLYPGPVSFFPYPVRDPNNLPLTFSLVTPLPASLQINPATGEIYGTLDALDWDFSSCQVQVSNGSFTVTGPVFTLYSYVVGGIETRSTVYGIEYASHTFSLDGFAVSGQTTVPFLVGRDLNYVEYLVVAGGGGGGTYIGGGGGGGGVRIGTTSLGIGSYTAVVGAGGAAAEAGFDSSLGSIVAVGGGSGGSSGVISALSYGVRATVGGSGGGGGITAFAQFSNGTIIVRNDHLGAAGTAGQGNAGGDGSPGNSGTNPIDSLYTRRGGAGGGGAGAAGSNGAVEVGGAGGNGIGLLFTGTLTYYAGGGGGSTIGYTQGAGGLGGGGSVASVSVNGAAGTGGGGAGGTSSVGGRGGSGVVIIRYPLYPEPAGVKRFGLVQWLDAADYTSGAIIWDDRVANYDASMFNSPVKSPDGGGSILFNGTTNLGTYSTPLEVTPITSYTLELWAKWTTVGTTSATIQTILDNSSTVAAPSFLLQDRPDAGKVLSFEYQQTSGNTALRSTSVIGDGSWHHIVVSCDFNTPTVRLYVDGNLENTVPSPSQSNRVIKGTTVIGRWDAGVALSSPRYYNGRLAVLRTYSRAFSADDVVNNYLTEVSRFGSAAQTAYGGTVTLYVVDNTAYRAHVFSSTAPDASTPGTFKVLSPIASADYMLLGGGGGGGASGGGGGGAGGLLLNSRSFAVGDFAVGSGAGGAGAASDTVRGSNGYPSSLDGVTVLGGGGGASRLGGLDAGVGGSGGGGGGQVSGTRYLGAAGTTGQGTAGGNGTGPADAGTSAAGGGGGGAGSAGAAASLLIAGSGGAGSILSITGIRTAYGGGGGGGIFVNGTIGSGGSGGGGAGSSSAGVAGTATSGGGGGGGGATGGRGGSGLVLVRYPTGSAAPVVDPNSANAVFLIPGLGYPNSTLPNWRDFSPMPEIYSPPNVANFDGTGDYLTVPGTTNFVFGTGDFTVESWVYATGASSRLFFDTRPSGGTGAYPALYLTGLNQFFYNINATDLITSPTVTPNAWHHVALSRKSGVSALFVNGTLVGRAADTTNCLAGSLVVVGGNANANSNHWSGSLSNFRITKGVARYEPTYTQPAAAFPDSVAGGDPYFAQVVLLLHGDGPNGSTTFTDSSSNALAATRVGNTVISTAQSKWGGSSILFDGSGDRLSYAANSTLFSFGAEDFTIECWFYIAGNSPLSAGNLRIASLCSAYPTTGTITGYNFFVLGNATTTGTGMSFESIQGGSSIQINFTSTVTQGVWHHAAVSRRGTVTRLFLDGVCMAAGTLSNQTVSTAQPLMVGGTQFTGYTYDLNGYIDDFRISKVARYTASFTPPQRYNTGGADPNFANVSLLLPFDEPAGARTFTDASTNAVTVTTVGDTVAGNRSLGTWLTTTPKAYGGSIYFDGTSSSDVQTLPVEAPVLGDFTIECWFNAASSSSVSKGLIVGGDTNLSGRSSIGLWLFESTLRVNRSVAGSFATILTATVPIGTWNHAALVRSGSYLTLLVNGAAVGTTLDTTRYYDRHFNIGWSLGAPGDNSAYRYIGYLQDARFYGGIAKYPAIGDDPNFNFVTLLLHCDGVNGSTTFTDSSFTGTAVTANGNVQISTARSRWGTASALFDGTGDFLSWAGTTFAASEDWTVECWVFKTAVDASGYTVLFWGSGNTQFVFDVTTAGSIGLIINGSTVIGASGTAVTLNTWHHLAWTRQGTTCRAFVNGVLQGTGTNSASFSLSNIGRYGQTPFGFEMNGNVDDIRITKGSCRYTANFTPPTGPFPDPWVYSMPSPLVT